MLEALPPKGNHWNEDDPFKQLNRAEKALVGSREVMYGVYYVRQVWEVFLCVRDKNQLQ